MEAVLVVEGNEEGKCEESGVEKSSSSLSSPKQIADPVVYKLVRVEGDGRLVPATDDEVMEVEDLLVDEQVDFPVVVNTRTVECISDESSSGKPQKESLEGLSASEGTEAEAKLNAQFEEIAASSSPSLDASHINETGTKGECSKHRDGPIESVSSASAGCTSSKLDFYASDREMCLDNLSIRELQDLFRATFGRETTVKDKLWLKRRIAMGLTNSCDVSTTTFTIIDNKLLKKGKDNSFQNAHDMHTEGSDGGAKNPGNEESPASHSSRLENHVVSAKRLGSLSEEEYGSEDHILDPRAAKRVRKPTKRYIEELSEVESRDHSPKVISSAKTSGHEETSLKYSARPLRNLSSNERTIVTRLDSLGGSGVQVPYVSRVRRSRPRKNIMALMNFNPSGMGVPAKLVKESLPVCASLPESESADRVLKARSTSEQIKPLFAAEPDNERQSAMGTFEHGKNLGLKQMDSSEEHSDDSIAAVPTVKGGMRRKHHRAWTLAEVMKLVEGVSKCGTGRWSEIKRLSFATFSYRTSVDLKDKWRNLLKASFAQTPPDDGSRKHIAVPIPASILLKVRELAEMHSQVPASIGVSKLGANVTRSVHHSAHQTRSGYL